MLWDVSTIRNYEIEATDGNIGTLSDVLCDDATWAIRWLVVDTGSFLPGRKVLLPPSVVKSLDRALGKVLVKLSTTEIENSPPFESDQPVSRQMEARMYVHFGLDPYWDNTLHGTGSHNLDQADSHLRSLNVMRGYQINATDGAIGQAADFLLDDEDWSIRYIVVDTGNWWPGQKVLISPQSVNSIAWADQVIRVSVAQEKVKSAPAYSPAMTVDGKYEEKFLTYYGIRWLEG
jgi:hypothetical protein